MGLQFEAVVIGVSAGGMNALSVLLTSLSKNFQLPIAIVQHRLASTDDFLITYLDTRCALTVKEPENREKIQSHHVYIAPPNYHLLIEEDKTFSFSTDEPICFSRPSVDVLFQSAANAYKTKLIGIVLTGANSDGSDGVVEIKAEGGMTIAQTPHTAYAAVMPQAAIDSGCIDFILDLNEIPHFLEELLESNHETQQR